MSLTIRQHMRGLMSDGRHNIRRKKATREGGHARVAGDSVFFWQRSVPKQKTAVSDDLQLRDSRVQPLFPGFGPYFSAAP